MDWLRQFVVRPRQVWLRRVSFQIHLWAGLILTLYLVVMGVSGSILVFREEMEAEDTEARPPFAQVSEVFRKFTAARPELRIVSISVPAANRAEFRVVAQGRRGQAGFRSDAVTGEYRGPVAPRRAWLGIVRELHATLLIGPGGRKVNAAGGALLLLLNATGMVVWWPGIRTWLRALFVDTRRGWRRINFDLHRALGFWTLGIASIWGVSAIYFGYSSAVTQLTEKLSPLVSARPPAIILERPEAGAAPQLSAMIAEALRRDPGTELSAVAFPYSRRAPLEVMLTRGHHSGREYTDTVYFNPYDGAYAGIWRYGVNETAGDWFIWSQIPLHYGTFWGLGFKILWSALGLTMPVLAVTGALMYWNRYLRRRWRDLPG